VQGDGATATDSIVAAVDDKISAVRTQSLDFSFNELADMYNDGELIIDPEFQRLFRWTKGAQSRFVESLILELPVPPISSNRAGGPRIRTHRWVAALLLLPALQRDFALGGGGAGASCARRV